MKKNIWFYLQFSEQFDVIYATEAFEEYTGIKLKVSHGFNWGGWHGSAEGKNFSLELFMNPYNVGRGVEYHRPEWPEALVMMLIRCSRAFYLELEAKLYDKNGVSLPITGFEKNLPKNIKFIKHER